MPATRVTKVAKLREAAHVFIDVMLPNDGIGLVRFNDTAQRIMEVEDAGAAPGGAGRTNGRSATSTATSSIRRAHVDRRRCRQRPRHAGRCAGGANTGL